LGSVAYWASAPNYVLLYSGMDQADTGQVIESLRSRGVEYELRDSGNAIYVPEEQVYELRASLAQTGVVSDGAPGYEKIFGGGTLGQTKVIIDMNMRRALEGELSRSITSLQQVDLARVHLVTPERSAFRETAVPPSASVVLKMTRGAGLSITQIDGIAALVAGAVEGLEQSDVTVIDTQGNVLSSGNDEEDQFAMSSTQLEVQRTVERDLVGKGQDMLNRVLGDGNSIVQISASLDFSRMVSNRELIDPESATVISEEKIDERLTDVSGANSSVRNYEMSRTTETHEKSVGTIQYLTVSIILNKRALPVPEDAEEGTEPIYYEYTQAELDEIEALVQNAVGFDAERGDRITISQRAFADEGLDPILAEFHAMEQSDRITSYFRYGLIALALVLAFLLVRRAGRQVTELRTTGFEGRLDGGGYYDSQGNLIGVPNQDRLSGGVAPGHTLASGGGDGMSIDDAFLGDLSDEEAALLHADRQLASGGAGGDPDMYAEKLDIRPRSEDPLFDQVRQFVSESPEDAAGVIRQWLSADSRARSL
ncbi:MAG: flagellar M-ring protein FliF, partial [Rhodothermales bacterium]|nr:flagellar M-ring protein FliF [Rhodothermales bacterium]